MSKKHFEAIAAAILYVRTMDPAVNPIVLTALEVLAKRLATIFAEDNARFDKQRFLRACGI